jgi:hypothetical protein
MQYDVISFNKGDNLFLQYQLWNYLIKYKPNMAYPENEDIPAVFELR